MDSKATSSTIGGRGEIAPLATLPVYQCGECGGRGSAPTHARTCSQYGKAAAA